MSLKDIINKIVADYNGKLFLNKKEAAKSLDVSTASIDNYRRIGQLKSINRGQRIMFSVETIAKAMRDGIDATGMKRQLSSNVEGA